MLARLSAAAVAGCVILSPLCHAQSSSEPAGGSGVPGSAASLTPSQRRILDDAIPLTPEMVRELNSPIVDDVQLLQWTVRAVLQTYSVDYHNYPKQLNDAGLYYSEQGWSTFTQSYIKVGNLEQMKKARLLCYAQAQRAATIPSTEIISGRLAYHVEFPMVQTCENTQQASTQLMMISALVVRTDDQRHPDGLVIERLVATPR